MKALQGVEAYVQGLKASGSVPQAECAHIRMAAPVAVQDGTGEHLEVLTGIGAKQG